MILEAIKPLQLVGQVAPWQSSSLSPILSPCRAVQAIWLSPKAIPEGNQKFKGQNQLPSSRSSALALLARVRCTAGAVAAGSNLLAWGKHDISLAILTQFKSQQGFSHFFKMWNEVFDGMGNLPISNLGRQVVADQSSAHLFTQTFYQSLVSELKYHVGTNCMFQIKSYAKHLSEERVSAQIGIE